MKRARAKPVPAAQVRELQRELRAANERAARAETTVDRLRENLRRLRWSVHEQERVVSEACQRMRKLAEPGGEG